MMKNNWVTGDVTPEDIESVAREEVKRETAENVSKEGLGDLFENLLYGV